MRREDDAVGGSLDCAPELSDYQIFCCYIVICEYSIEWGNYDVRTRKSNSPQVSIKIFLWGFIMGFFQFME